MFSTSSILIFRLEENVPPGTRWTSNAQSALRFLRQYAVPAATRDNGPPLSTEGPGAERGGCRGRKISASHPLKSPPYIMNRPASPVPYMPASEHSLRARIVRVEQSGVSDVATESWIMEREWVSWRRSGRSTSPIASYAKR
jgi:hypothetical protein